MGGWMEELELRKALNLGFGLGIGKIRRATTNSFLEEIPFSFLYFSKQLEEATLEAEQAYKLGTMKKSKSDFNVCHLFYFSVIR